MQLRMWEYMIFLVGFLWLWLDDFAKYQMHDYFFMILSDTKHAL